MGKSIAVAYSMKKKQKKASGGMVNSGDPEMNYAKGGILEGKKRSESQIGVHKNTLIKGESNAGVVAREAKEAGNKEAHESFNDKAKQRHGEVLEELKSMKGPHGNYADGGTVEETPDQAGSAPPVNEEEAKKFAQGMCPSCGYSEGGMVANDTGEGASADENPNEFDDLVLRDGLEFSETGENSGDKLGGPSKDDLVARAMLKRKVKR